MATAYDTNYRHHKMVWTDAFSEVTLSQIATAKSSFLSFISGGLRLGCIAFVIYGIYVQKKYQAASVGVGSVITRVQASADTRNRSDLPNSPEYRRTWDETDIVQSITEDDALAIMTNSIITPLQKLSDCPEDINVVGAYCTSTNFTSCAKGTRLSTGNGLMTGRCVDSSGELCNDLRSSSCTCEVSGWCPVESRFASASPLFPGAKDFKILVKAYAEYSEFGEHRQNVRDDQTDAELLNDCSYDAKLNPLCPVFTIGYILQQVNLVNFTQIAMEGALIRMTIKWLCNFDTGHEHECLSPTYTFEQLDAFTVNRLLPFWNLREISKYHDCNGTLRRDTNRITSIFILFDIDAKGGKFSLINSLLALGAAVGLFSMVPGVLEAVVDLFKVYHPGAASAKTEGTADESKEKDWKEKVDDWKEDIKNWIGSVHCKCKNGLVVAVVATLFLIGAIVSTIFAVRNDSAIVDWVALVVDSLFIVILIAIVGAGTGLCLPSHFTAKWLLTPRSGCCCKIVYYFLILFFPFIFVGLFMFMQVGFMFWFNMFGEFTPLEVLIRMALMCVIDAIIGIGVNNSGSVLFSCRSAAKRLCCKCCCSDDSKSSYKTSCSETWSEFCRNMAQLRHKREDSHRTEAA